MDCSPQASSVHGILQVRILEWVANSFSRGSSQPRDQTQISCIADRLFFFTVWATSTAIDPGLSVSSAVGGLSSLPFLLSFVSVVHHISQLLPFVPLPHLLEKKKKKKKNQLWINRVILLSPGLHSGHWALLGHDFPGWHSFSLMVTNLNRSLNSDRPALSPSH